MLTCHVSQHAWVARQHDVPDHVAAMEAWTRRRGRDFGIEMGEGFRQYRHHPYPRTPLLQELLDGAGVAWRDAAMSLMSTLEDIEVEAAVNRGPIALREGERRPLFIAPA